MTDYAIKRVEGNLPQLSSLQWYVDRCNLIKNYFGDKTGSELRKMQYEIDEYKETTWKDCIKDVQEKVKAEFFELYGENLMKFNFDNFANEIFERHKDSFSLEEIKDLLNVDNKYDYDISSTNKNRLLLESIHFTGVKSENLKNAEINFSQELHSGVTMWVADNLKGKSSLFKIIQLALTGNDKLKTDIGK